MKESRPAPATRRKGGRLPVVIALAAAVALPAPGPSEEEAATSIVTSLHELRRTLQSIDANLREQERSWPRHREDLANEELPPPTVQQLQATCRRLEATRDALLWRIRWAASRNGELRWLGREKPVEIAPLLSALEESEDLALVDALVPIVTRAGRRDVRTTGTLEALARRFEPCPLSVANGLADLESERASLVLLELGKRETNPVLLRAAGRSGEPQVLEQLIDLAEGTDPALARASLRALSRLEPPAEVGPRHEALEKLVAARIESVRSQELKVSLIAYFGLARSRFSFSVLAAVHANSPDERIRLAAIGALGNLGAEAGDLLLRELRRPDNSGAIRRAAVHSLGASRYRPALRPLIELLEDPSLRRDALRALRRLSGADPGDRKGHWLRWWKSQPEGRRAPRDPDEE